MTEGPATGTERDDRPAAHGHAACGARAAPAAGGGAAGRLTTRTAGRGSGRRPEPGPPTYRLQRSAYSASRPAAPRTH
eukprot:1814528-Prymnesium_polylepis.1